MASSNLIIPKLEAPKQFFTADEADYTTITKWLEVNQLDYYRFYASFLNYAIKLACHRKDPKQKDKLTEKDHALLSIFEDVPVQTQGFLDAMGAYGQDRWDRGHSAGIIDLKHGRVATDDIKNAHKVLAAQLYSSNQRKEFKAANPDLGWLLESAAVERRRRKVQNRVAARLGTMSLGENPGADEAN